MTNTLPPVGSRVRIERDETLYPSKGTWPWYRGKRGTVVEHNLGEVGVSFGKVNIPKDPVKARRSLDWKAEDVHWFQRWEVTLIVPQSPQRVVDSHYTPSEGDSARESLVHA